MPTEPASLARYREKRDFTRTREPAGTRAKAVRARAGSRFVVQKHAASRLHYDFRLELGGVLKSWAVPKGVPFKKGEKRLAVEVEDHPVSYIDFEGTIPKGQYGGGTVMVWDRGTFTADTADPLQSLRSGKLHVTLKGKKLKGEWYLVRLRDEKQWLLIKGGAGMRPVSEKLDDTSARSGKSMAQLGRGGSVWASRPARVATRVRRPPPSRRLNSRVRPLEFVPPMLARLVSTAPRGRWLYEIKFDGYRAALLKNGEQIQLLSRNQKDLGHRFPEVLEAARRLRARRAIVDGEVVAVDGKGRPSFQLLQAYQLGEERPPLLYYAFDLLDLDGEDWVDRPLEERKAALEKIIPKRGLIRYSASLGADAARLLPQIRRHGLEGLIGKQAESRYEAGQRSGAWVKLKVHQAQEVVIGGYTEPEGSRAHFGALLVGVFDGRRLHFSGKVGTGFNESVLRALKRRMAPLEQAACPFTDLPEARPGRWGQGITRAEMKRCHWVKPVLVCQVKFFEWTQGHKLRHPVFVGLRDDKAARAVVREAA